MSLADVHKCRFTGVALLYFESLLSLPTQSTTR